MITLENKFLRIGLSETTDGGLTLFEDVATGRNFIVSGPHPLYRMTLAQLGGKPIEVTSLDAEHCLVERVSEPGCETVVLTYDGHHSADVRVTCKVILEANSPISRWEISVQNNTPYAVRAIHYPVVATPLTLSKNGEDDCYVWSRLGGMVIKSPSINPPGFAVRGHYPGTQSAQLQLFYDSTAGLYMAAYDGNGCVKHFGLRRMDDRLDLSIEHNYDETPGLSFALPYQTVLGVFHGDWYQAADIYKAWATKQHWCSKKLVERTDVPEWLKQGRPYLMFMQIGHQPTLWHGALRTAAELPNSRYFPSKKLPPLMNRYAYALRTRVIPLWIGWQKWGDCIGPDDMFPDGKGGIKAETWKEFKQAVTRLWRDDNPPILLIPGLHWTYLKRSTGFEGMARFQKEGRKGASLDESGEIRHSVWPMKCFAHLCHGSAYVRRIFLGIVSKMLDAGVPLIQYDVFHGGQPHVPCYSAKHGHVPGYGPWMYKDSLTLLRKSRQLVKKHNPKFALSVETPCETVIQELDVAMYRPNVGIPLYSYLYHEYAVGYGGDDETDFSHPEQELIKLAMFVRDGTSFIACIGKPEFDLELTPRHPTMELLRNSCEAMRTYANKYLILGTMLKPTRLTVATTPVGFFSESGSGGPKGPQGRYMTNHVDMPRVLHSVWKAPDGKIGYVLVNWTGSPEKVMLGLVCPGGRGTIVTGRDKKPLPDKEIGSGNITSTVPARSVVLIEQEIEND